MMNISYQYKQTQMSDQLIYTKVQICMNSNDELHTCIGKL